MARLPRSQIDLDLATGLLGSGSARHVDLDAVRTGLLRHALGSTEQVEKIAECPPVGDSYSHWPQLGSLRPSRPHIGSVLGRGPSFGYSSGVRHDYDAVEAGLALCDLVVVAAAERSLLAGETTWNAVKRRWLAEGGEIEAVDLEGLFWIDVDTPGDVRRAERLILASAARKPWDGPVARLLNRRLSWRLSLLLLLRAGASPNAATLFAFLLALLSAGALAAGHEWSAALVAGGVLTQIASVADGVDGEIARASLRASPSGAFLDSVLDRIADAALLAGLALAAGLDTATWAALAAALFGSLQVPYVRASYEASFGQPFPPSTYRLGAGRDVRLLVVAVSAVALQPLGGLVAVALLANLEVAHRVARAWRARPWYA